MAQHIPKGKAHRNERAAIDYLVEKLPASYGVFSNIEFAIPGRPGQTYEHDAVIVTPHMVFTVELKAWGGPIEAGRDRWVLDDGTLKTSPITLQQQKARVLKSALSGRHHSLRGRHLWVQALVFLTKRDAQPAVESGFEAFVCTYKNIIEALSDPKFWRQNTQFSRTQLQEISSFLHGGDARRAGRRFHNFKLVDRLPVSERTPYEAWRGLRLGQPRTLHVYPIEAGSTKGDRRLRDRALREVALQERLRNGPNLLSYYDLDKVLDGPEHAYILNFEDVGRLMPMMQWVRQHRPGLDARLEVARRLATALRFMHTRRIVHRRLSPEAVLVTHEPFPQAVKLCAVELARDLTQKIRTIGTEALDDPSYRYMAPEQVHSGEATERSDLFALGATLFELFNGRPLFGKADDTLRPYTVPPLHVGETPLPDGAAVAIAYLLDRDPTSRTSLDELIEELTPLRAAAVSPTKAIEFKPKVQVGNYTLDVCLRPGVVSVWRATHRYDGSKVVLKIGPTGDESIGREVEALKTLHHPNIAHYRGLSPVDDTRGMLVISAVEGVDGAVHAGAGDVVDALTIGIMGQGLFAALGTMHTAGWLHRDVKPENVLLEAPGLRPVLIDFGLATRIADPGQLVPGTPQYKDPHLYEIGRWETRDDLFSAWLTLYEIATGVHPFGGQPALDVPLRARESDFADTIDDEIKGRLVTLFALALGPPKARPQTAEEASTALEMALGGAQTQQVGIHYAPRPAPSVEIRAGVQLRTPIESLGLSVRAFRALSRLGVQTAGQVRRVTPTMLRGLRNVGRKTAAEIVAIQAALVVAFGQEIDKTIEPSPPQPLLAPSLLDDPRPLEELGRALTKTLRAHFMALGISTVGELASLPASLVLELEGVGAKRVASIEKALKALAGQDERPADLPALHALLKKELGRRFAPLDALYGLSTGQALTAEDAAEAIGKTRQYVHASADLDELRTDASVAHHLIEAMEAALPSCGFSTLASAAARLATRLPTDDAGPSAQGYARLAAMLLHPPLGADERATKHAHQDVDFVFRPPWQREFIQDLRAHLSQLVAEEPMPYADAQAEVLERAKLLGMTAALQRFGAEGSALLDALLVLDEHIQQTKRDECLYQPPIHFGDAVVFLADQISLPTTRDELVARVTQTFEGGLEVNDDELAEVLTVLDWHTYSDGYIAGPDYEPLAPMEAVYTDISLPEVRAGDDGRLDLGILIPSIERGGFRVVALPAATHHRQCQAVADALGGRLVDVDRVLIEALRAHDMFDDALFYEADEAPDFSWAHEELIAALDAAMVEARPGVVTVLGRPCLLGPLGLTRWVSGFYERARGGRHGLVVFAPPANIEDNRVKLNGRYPLPYTPDMAAPVIRAEANTSLEPIQGALS